MFLRFTSKTIIFCLAIAFLVKGFYGYILEGPLRITVLLKIIIFRETLKEYSHWHKPNILCQTKRTHLSGQAQKCKIL